MWPRINRVQIGPTERFDLEAQALLEECEAVARTRAGWTVDLVAVAQGRIDASRRSRLGLLDRVTVQVGESIGLEVAGRGPRWRLNRLADGYLRAVRAAVARRRRGQEAGT
jgi:hypothetical protein